VKIIPLHQRGEHGSDVFGSDFAVSLSNHDFNKVAIIQTKMADRSSVRLELNQLQSALGSDLPHQVFYSMSIHRERPDFRLQSAKTSLDNWPTGATKSPASHGFDTRKWLGVQEWTRAWLQCQHGRISRDQFKLIEARLQAHSASAMPPMWFPSALIQIVLPKRSDRYEWR
jgi:hypothetical protein